MRPSSPDAGGKQDLRARRRSELMNTVQRLALRRFLRDGYEETSVADICADAGISVRTFFRHFASKDEIVGQVGVRLNELILRHLRSQDDDQLLIDAFYKAYVAAITELFRGDEQYARDALIVSGELSQVRGIFILKGLEALYDPEIDDLDREFGRRLGIAESDPQIRLLRGFLFICVNQAVAQWDTRDEADLGALVHQSFALLAALERANFPEPALRKQQSGSR